MKYIFILLILLISLTYSPYLTARTIRPVLNPVIEKIVNTLEDFLQAAPENFDKVKILINFLSSRDKPVQIKGLEILLKLPENIKKILLPLAEQRLFEFMKDNDRNVQETAAKVLAKLSKENNNTIDKLLEFADNGNDKDKEIVAFILGKSGIKNKIIIDKLFEFIESENLELQKTSIVALGTLRVKDDRVIEKLLEFTEPDTNTGLRIVTIKSLGKSKTDDKRVFNRLLELAEEQSTGIQDACAYAFGKLGVKNDRVIKILLKLSHDWHLQPAVANALGKLQIITPEVIDKLIELTYQEGFKIKISAIKGLGILGAKDEKIINRLKDIYVETDNLKIKVEIALALEKLGIKDKKQELSAELISIKTFPISYNPDLKTTIAYAFARLGIVNDEIINKLIEFSNHHDPNVREAVAYALGELGFKNEEIIDILWKLTKDEKNNVRHKAYESLEKLFF